jgi:hypothetical protein
VADSASVGDRVKEGLKGDAGASFVAGRGVERAEEGRIEQGLRKKETDSPDIILKGIDWTLGSDIQGEKRRENFSAFERHCQKSLPPSPFLRDRVTT